jgi:pyruvate dehydrogenase E1 component
LLAYDPAFAYEVAVIVQEGLRRMYQDEESIFYYLTLYNQSYPMPAMPEGAREGILRGMYAVCSIEIEGERTVSSRPQLLASGPLVQEAERAQVLLAERFGIATDLWSVTSYSQLQREAAEVHRWNALHPNEEPRTSYLEEVLQEVPGPFVAVSDYVRLVPEQIRPWIPEPYHTLGTDGFGRSDTRQALRRYFEVDAEHIALATLTALTEAGEFSRGKLGQAIVELEIDPDKPNPATA